MSDETPYALAKRLRVEGRSEAEVLTALRSLGLDEEEAQIAARASRGEAGIAPGVGREVEATPDDVDAAPSDEPPAHPCPKHAQWPVLEPCTRCGSFFCRACLQEAQIPLGKNRAMCAACFAKEPVPAQGIGGLLLFPALNLALSTTLSLIVLPFLFVLEFDHSKINVELIALECLGRVVVGVWASLAFFRKKKGTPLRMVAFYGLSLTFALISALTDTMASLTTVPFSVVWMVYFLSSKRVEATFTRA